MSLPLHAFFQFDTVNIDARIDVLPDYCMLVVSWGVMSRIRKPLAFEDAPTDIEGLKQKSIEVYERQKKGLAHEKTTCELYRETLA